MDSLKIFLDSLKEALQNRGLFVDVLVITPQKPMPAYKKYTVEVWNVDGKNKTLVSTASVVGKSTNDKEDSEIKKILVKESIINVLKYYGV